MEDFVLYNPTRLIFGKGMIENIGQEIKSFGFKKILLLAGGGSIKENGVYFRVTGSLSRSGISWKECWGIRSNPVLSKVKEIIALAKEEKVQALLAVGGGSVIDSAKSAAAGIYVPDVWRLYEDKSAVNMAMPLFTVLTISATGSEMNSYAVLTNEREGKKWNISGPALYPKVSIVDPSVQFSLPWPQTVNGAIDALSHIMEFYFIGGDSETTLALDESLFKTIIALTDAVRLAPDDYNLRANFAWAATLALNGISGAGQGGGDWASHGIEHAISAVNPDIAHGAGLGVVFPAWIAYCRDINPEIFSRWARNIWGTQDINRAVLAMKEKLKSWGFPVTLRELGVAENQIKLIAELAYNGGLRGTVKPLDKKDILNILLSAFS